MVSNPHPRWPTYYPRKRKREILEEEADMDEVEYEEKLAKDSILPSMLELPEDDTGLQIN